MSSKILADLKSPLNIEHLEDILDLLRKNHFPSSSYRPLGSSLGLYDNTLKDINADYDFVEDKLRECLSAWLRKKDRASVPEGDDIGSDVRPLQQSEPSMEGLISALKKIKVNDVADKIEDELMAKIDERSYTVLLLPPEPKKEDPLTQPTKEDQPTKEEPALANKEDNKHYLNFFDIYYDRLFTLLAQNKDVCYKFVMTLCNEQLISLAEKESVERQSHLGIKSKMLLESLRLLLKNAKSPEMTLKKILLIFKDYDLDLYEEMTQAMSTDVKFHSEIKARLFSTITIQRPLEASDHSSTSSQFPFPSVPKILRRLWSDPIQMYSEKLKSIYSNQKIPSLLTSLCDKYDINDSSLPFVEPVMALIDPSHSGSLNGSIESIKRNKTIISFDYLCSIPRSSSRYLIEGRTGMGKTRLAFELRNRWVEGRALTDYSLFLFIQMSDIKLQKEVTEATDDRLALRHFISYYMSSESWNDVALQTIIDKGGEGIFIVLEGYNELRKNYQSKSLFFDIVSGKCLPRATVLVTSQLVKGSPIKKATNNLRVISVVGFDQKAIDRFTSISLTPEKRENLKTLPHRIKSCLFIPIILHLVIFLIQNSTVNISSLTHSTQLYNLLVQCIIDVACSDKDSSRLSRSEINRYKLKMGCLAWKGINKNKRNFKRRDNFETLGLMQKDHGPQRDSSFRYSFLHDTIQDFLAAYFIVEKFPDKLEKVFKRCRDYPRFSGALVFLAGLIPGGQDVLPPLSSKIFNFDMIHQLYEAQCNQVTTLDGGNKIELRQSFPFPHDMIALGYCIAKSSSQWSLGFTLRSISKEHIEMLILGMGREVNGRIVELNLSLNELGPEGVAALLRIPECVFESLSSLNLRGNGLSGYEVSIDVTKFILLPCLKKFDFHHNHFDMTKDEQLPVVEAICQSNSLTYVSLSNLSPKECQVLLSHNHKVLKVIDLYQLEFESLEACFNSLTKSSVNTLKIHDSHITPKHSRLFPEILLKAVSSIKILELSNCALNDDSAAHIADAIEICQIRILNLNDNLISDDGCPSLLRMIKSKRLDHLNLQRNLFGEDTARELASSVSTKHLKLHLSPKWENSIDVQGIIFD